MACPSSVDVIDLVDGLFWETLFCWFSNQVGAPVVGLFVFGSVAVALYISSGGRIEVPLMLMMVAGAAIAPFTPTFVVGTAVVVFLVVFPAAGLLVLRRLDRGV